MIKTARVKALMAYHGLTQTQLAEMVGVSHDKMNRMINYPIPKDHKLWDPLAKALGTEVGAITKDVVVLKFNDSRRRTNQ